MHQLEVLMLGMIGMFAGVAAAQQPAAAPAQQHVRGDVVALEGQTLTVKSRGGETVTLKLADDTRVAVVSKADLASLRSGAFIGTTAVPQGAGMLRAVEVHVFPEAMRGTGEGHRPWDLEPGSTMTNATVAEVDAAGGKAPPSTMTNATVAEVAKAGAGRKLVLKYSSGEKTVLMPPGTPVVMIEPGDRSRLVPGAHLFAIASRQPDGSLRAERINVGKDGVVPPM